jgi:Polyketide cyclase / dehydrase and lipid transport
MSNPTFSDSVVIARPPEAVYDIVADVTRMGEFSPQCRVCWWDDGCGPEPGSWFTGRNEIPGRTWETRSVVVAAERGREFTWLVGGSYVRWSYRFEAVPEGTELTETWEYLPDGIQLMHSRYPDDPEAQIEFRARAAREGIPVTLAAIKKAAEAG